jgi:hypothetical protein
MPDFCRGGAVFPASGFGQLSGTEVMPVFFGDAAIFPATGGTAVKPWHTGHEISLPADSSSHARRCPQWEQLNLIRLIKLPFLMGYIISETAQSSSFFFHGMGLSWGGFSKNS